MGTRGGVGNLSKLPIKKILILDEHVCYEAGKQLPHRRSNCVASALYSLARTTAETIVSPASHREDPHVSVRKNYKVNNIKGENIKTWRKINIFLPFVFS